MAAAYSGVMGRLHNRVRYGLTLLRDRTLRIRIGGISRFYQQMNSAGLPYVVLRWADEIPTDPKAESAHDRDIDHLVGDGILPRILTLALPFSGPLKCDFYTRRGDRGGAYLGMPYYMPELARGILDRRVPHPNGFYVPAPRDACLSFLYHLVYHKGARSGIATGLDGVATDPSPSRDYAAEAQRLATLAGIALPVPLTLAALHQTLQSDGWSMATDLMLRWPDSHPVLLALMQGERARAAAISDQVRGLTVFLLRDDAPGDAVRQIALSRIAERFTILETLILSGPAMDRVVLQTRGGNWTEKGKDHPSLPTFAILCRNAPQPGTLPVSMSAAKVRKRYPHLENTDILIKRVIRDQALALPGVARGATVIHSTDNPFETGETLRAIFDTDLPQALKRLL